MRKTLFLLALLNFCCQSEPVDQSSESDYVKVNEFAVLAEKTWRECCNREVDVTLDKIENGNVFHFQYDVHSPSYLDDESRSLLLAVHAYALRKKDPKIQGLMIRYFDEGFDNESFEYSFDSLRIREIEQNFDKSDGFLNLVSSSFFNLNFDDLVRCEVILRNLNNVYGDQFDFTGSYWALLNDYCKNRSPQHPLVTFVAAAQTEKSGFPEGKFEFLVNDIRNR